MAPLLTTAVLYVSTYLFLLVAPLMMAMCDIVVLLIVLSGPVFVGFLADCLDQFVFETFLSVMYF